MNPESPRALPKGLLAKDLYHKLAALIWFVPKHFSFRLHRVDGRAENL